MAGLNDILQGAFIGGKPGPNAGQDVSAETTFNPQTPKVLPRDGSDLLLSALGAPQTETTRAQRALKRRGFDVGR